MTGSRSDRTVVVATFPHRHLAEMAGGYLRDAGIRAAVSADDGGGAFGAPLTFSEASFARVRVMEDDADAAERALREGGFLDEGGTQG